MGNGGKCFFLSFALMGGGNLSSVSWSSGSSYKHKYTLKHLSGHSSLCNRRTLNHVPNPYSDKFHTQTHPNIEWVRAIPRRRPSWQLLFGQLGPACHPQKWTTVRYGPVKAQSLGRQFLQSSNFPRQHWILFDCRLQSFQWSDLRSRLLNTGRHLSQSSLPAVCQMLPLFALPPKRSEAQCCSWFCNRLGCTQYFTLLSKDTPHPTLLFLRGLGPRKLSSFKACVV